MSDQRAELATMFEQMAAMLDIQGADYHRVLAYRRAAETLRGLAEPLESLAQADHLELLPGIGVVFAEKIREYLRTQTLSAYQTLSAQVPLGLLDLLQVPGVGPRKAALFWQALGITTFDELEFAAQSGQLQQLKGVGARTERNVLEGLRALQRQRRGRVPLAVAWPLAQEVVTALQSAPGVQQAAPVGSLRRMREMVGALDILAAADDSEPALACFCALPVAVEVLQRSTGRASIRTAEGLQIDLFVYPAARWGSALLQFTGSRAHNVRLRALAQARGLTLSEYGLCDSAGGEQLYADEESLYATLGLPWIPPELREDRGEIEAALVGQLPRLLQMADLRGDFQCHTTRSDGDHVLEEMARAARAAGLSYLVVSDHTAGLGIVPGMQPEALESLLAEVAAVNARLGDGFRVLAGAEVEIGPDGALDWPDPLLARLDFVIGSMHTGLNQPRAQLTTRLLTALQNPYLDLIGHPTGRLLGRRDPADIDMEAVFRAARARGVALEVSAWPLRLDLDDVYVRRAVELGVQLAISSDAHDVDGFAVLPFGVAVARRGWAEPHHLLNTHSWDEVRAWQRQRKTVRDL